MFYCEKCRVGNTWPESFGKSRGRCELCKEYAVCNDRPSSTFPAPPQKQSIIDDTSYWW